MRELTKWVIVATALCIFRKALSLYLRLYAKAAESKDNADTHERIIWQLEKGLRQLKDARKAASASMRDSQR